MCHCGNEVYTTEYGFSRDLCESCTYARCDSPVEGEYYKCEEVKGFHGNS